MNKTAKKAVKITSIALGALVGLFLLLYAILAIIGAASYGEARGARAYVCDIAGISDGIAPQGLAYSKEKDLYIQTGYGGNNDTLLYIVEDGNARRVKLEDENGETLKGHAGGVTCTKDCVYIANGAQLQLFSLAELTAADADTAVKVKRSYHVDNRAAYCHSNDTELFVGEFYRAGNYETEQSHYYTTPEGEDNKAIVSCYKLDAQGLLIEENGQPYPEYCISVTGLVQGFVLEKGTAVLSRSYGLSNSSLEFHSFPKDGGANIAVKFLRNPQAEQKTVPLYYLGAATMVKTLTLPAFSEDLTVVGDRVAVTNEASANKYIVGKFFGSHKVYSYPFYKGE